MSSSSLMFKVQARLAHLSAFKGNAVAVKSNHVSLFEAERGGNWCNQSTNMLLKSIVLRV